MLRIYFNLSWGGVRTESRSFAPEDGVLLAGTDEQAHLPLFGFTLPAESYPIAEWESDPSRIKRFPEQLVLSSQRNVMGYFNPEADPARTCFPAGQGIGGFREIKPAGDVLREIVGQAERVLAGLAAR